MAFCKAAQTPVRMGGVFELAAKIITVKYV